MYSQHRCWPCYFFPACIKREYSVGEGVSKDDQTTYFWALPASGQVCDSALSLDIAADDQECAPREALRENPFHRLRKSRP